MNKTKTMHERHVPIDYLIKSKVFVIQLFRGTFISLHLGAFHLVTQVDTNIILSLLLIKCQKS